MALKRGTRLGPYEVLDSIGQGGMGEVYRATDTKLRRDVAIKVLPQNVAGDRERLGRFEREAQVLASLNHPHIASIYGLEESDGGPCLVLELVEGLTLAERLAREPLPVQEVLDLGRQIASALEAAHEKGIIHRDLKPGNVKVTPEGIAKVLDFGLAKTFAPESPPAEASNLPTLAEPATREGAILGTVPYMSPEQVRGERLDSRTDIWAFGCVMYEMLTGRPAFSGETPVDYAAAILEREPDWDALRGKSPTGVDRLIRRCLRKDPKRRLHDIADARIELEEAQDEAEGGAEPLSAIPPSRPWRAGFLWALAGVIVGALIATLVEGLRDPAPRSPSTVVQASLSSPGDVTPRDVSVPSVTVSPDGQAVVFQGRGPGGVQLYRRAFDETAAEPIPGTEGGAAPFFSPDGEWIAFFADEQLLKVPAAGGTPIKLCFATPVPRGGTWAPGNRVIYARSYNGPLYVVPGSGGDPLPLTHLEPGEHAHLYPQILPGERLLFTVAGGRDFQDVTASKVVALDVETGERRVVLEGATFARYVGDGWIAFLRGSSGFAAPLDLRTLQVTASPVALPPTMAVDLPHRTAQFDVTPDGTLVYVAGEAATLPVAEVLSLDRSGNETPVGIRQANQYGSPSLSPDGRRLALDLCDGFRCTVFVFDADRQVLFSPVPDAGRFFSATWSPDGRKLAMTFVSDGNPRLIVRSADGSGSIEWPTPPTEDAEMANSWSPDGRTIAYTVIYVADHGGSRLRGTSDIWLASLDGSSPPRPWMETPHRETSARFSPDGDFLAYVSDESGENEVYVRPVIGEEKFQISNGGGIEPVWTSGGREILYRQAARFIAVALGPGPSLRPGPPHFLFAGRFGRGAGRSDMHHTWDASPDGQEFIVLRTTFPPAPGRDLAVMTGWRGRLDRAGGGS